MTREEVFHNVAERVINGMMLHSELADYYCFLCVPKFADMHEDRYCDESKMYRQICRFCLTTHNRLITAPQFTYESVIPPTWYKYDRFEIDTSTIRNGAKRGFETWVEWEKETKKVYEKMYSELLSMNEIDSAEEVKRLVCDVSEELKTAEKIHLRLKAMDYTISAILQ